MFNYTKENLEKRVTETRKSYACFGGCSEDPIWESWDNLFIGTDSDNIIVSSHLNDDEIDPITSLEICFCKEGRRVQFCEELQCWVLWVGSSWCTGGEDEYKIIPKEISEKW